VATALNALMSMPSVALAPHATPIDELERLRAAIGASCPRVFVKRDDLLSFALGGNKVRKMELVLAEAIAAGADTLITCGGPQSNHARVTAAAGASRGLRVILVLNGEPPLADTGNAALYQLFGADVRFVPSRDDRARTMVHIADELRAAGHRPFVVPLGASTPTGALGFARAFKEIAASGLKPDAIVHSTSSGGTQAGMIAGAALFGVRGRILGISADDPADALTKTIQTILSGIGSRLGAAPATIGADRSIDVDDRWVGAGYGIPSRESTEARELVARTEGIVLDRTYTAKAMAALLGRIRAGEFGKEDTILFWHTGGIG
jgi:1-aminocyclopropane-1-carboxylate deaminase/D-cysteine desulfhydrase-like pyridoxal-dependent ACC family enzyme